MKPKIFVAAFVGTYIFFLAAGIAFGGAFDNSAIGAQGVAMGNALTGFGDDSSAVYYNPAGMIGQKDTWRGELYTIINFTQFEYTANQIEDESKETYLLPGFFASRSFENWAFNFEEPARHQNQ